MSQELTLSFPAKDSLQRSESLRRALNAQVSKVERSIVANKTRVAQAAGGAREAVKQQVQNRVKDNTALSKAAEARVRSVDDCIKETSLWQTKLHHERYKQFAAMKVTERRILIREENPPEFAKDSLNDALEQELKFLRKARSDFLDMEGKVKRIMEELEAVRAELSKEAARRRMSVAADQAILVNVALAGAVAPGARSIPGTSSELEITVMSDEESRQVNQLSMQLEDEASQLRRQAKSCICCIRDECTQAKLRVEKNLTKRTEQTSEVTKRLIGQGKEVDYTIIQAQRSLQIQKKSFDSKDRKTGANFESAENTLQELMQSRQDLKRDLHAKTILLSTSEACRKVTPQTASSPAARPRPSTATGVRTNNSRRQRMGSAHSTTSSTPALPALAPSNNLRTTTANLDNPQAQTPTAFESGGMDLQVPAPMEAEDTFEADTK